MKARNGGVTEPCRLQQYTLDQLAPIMQQVLDCGGEFRFYPRGTSMLPLLRQGIDSVAIVSPPPRLRRRDIPLYIRPDGHYVLHRVMGMDEDGYIMCGDNQLSPEHGITHDRVCGVVRAIYRGRRQRRCEVTSLGLRLYGAVWCIMPLRRIALFCRRVWTRLRGR